MPSPTLSQNLRVGLDALRANPLRAVLSTLGVIIGAGALVAVLSVGDGLEETMREQLDATTSVLFFSVTPVTTETVDGQELPLFLVDYTSLPLSVGVLSGLMWLPMSWFLRHCVGIAHAVARTLLVTAAWLLWPSARFVSVPAVIVVLYLLVIGVLEARWRGLAGEGTSDD
jgi:hypothetical protein